ncbi:unnamed protein product [Cunninghamella echinulata]
MNPTFSSASLPAPPPIVSISTTLQPLSSSHLTGHVSPLDTSFDIVRSTALPIPTTTNHHLSKTIYEEKIDEEYTKGNHEKDNGGYHNEDEEDDEEENNNKDNDDDDDEEESEKNSHGTLTPPYSRFTPTSHFLNPLTSLSNANNHSHLVAAMTTPTPTSSTSFLHSSPSPHSQQQYQHSPNTSSSLIPPHSVNDQHHHPSSLTSNTSSSTSTNLDNNTNQQNHQNHSNTTIADLSTSVSSISSLFSRRNSVRYINSPQRKPKNNLTKTKSSFVLKMIIHERLAHILANRHIDDSYIFFNIGTSFVWMDSKGKPKEPLSRIVFTKAYPTCHDINTLTKCNEHLDVIIGFSSGDCVWYDPLTSKYFRLNKNGCIKNGTVNAIKWIPGSEDLFMVAFSDGTMLILDKDREDQLFTPTQPHTWVEQQFHVTKPHKSAKYNPVAHWFINEKGVQNFEFSPDGNHVAITGLDGTLRIIDYRQERLLDVFASYYGNFTCVAWSPDGKYILTGGQDDLVTIWGFLERRIVARCQGHKSWVTSVAFDPYRCDDKIYRFGSVGEDCKLILWDFSFSALHRPKNKHRGTASSPRSPRSPKDTHRFSFVGTDNLKNRAPILTPQLFDRLSNNIEVHDQPPPPSPTSPITFGFKRRSFSTKKQSSSSSSNINKYSHHHHHPPPPTSSSSSHRLPINTDYHHLNHHHINHFETQHTTMPTLHPSPNKTQVPLLQPSTIKTIHADPCMNILFRYDAIVTTDRRGRIRTWGRP